MRILPVFIASHHTDQDKDETTESLARGLPVVSISIGDAADFIYGPTPNTDDAQCIRLESGDCIVFGGACLSS